MAHAQASISHPVRPLGERIAANLRYGWNRYWARRVQRATVSALHALDDHTLKDIGLDRSEIESLVYVLPQGSGRRVAASNGRL